MDYTIVKSDNPKFAPILFLHGWGGNKTSFFFLKKAFKDRDSYFISFAGHGESPPPKKPMTVLDFAEEIKNFIVQQKIKPNIVAHSFGGRVALVLCSKYPSIVGDVVLTGCAGLKPKRGFAYHKKVFKFKIKKWLVRLHLMNKNRLNNCGSADYNVLSENMRQTFKNVVNQNLKNVAKKVKNKTLLVWGESDTETPLKMGQKLNKYIKGSELVIFNGGSHFCFLEEPVRFVLILRFFFVS